ncbi:hypothetical protein ACHAXR_010910 [Thalassiosira sp. AJA248-18]
MAIDKIFYFILLWSIISTTLLVHQFQGNTELQRQLSTKQEKEHTNLKKAQRMSKLEAKFRDSKNLMGKKPRRNIMNQKRIKEDDHRPQLINKDHHAVHKKQDHNKTSMAANTMFYRKFPFTRSLENFRRDKSFFLYVVHGTSSSHSGGDANPSPSSPLEWSEIRWGDLVQNWRRNTTFDNLLQVSTSLKQHRRANSDEVTMQKKLVLHCLPKAASTTLRKACYKNIRDDCKDLEWPTQADPFGYRKVDDFFRVVKECDDINHYCVQGGDAEMSIINYDKNTDDRDPIHFVHMVPFRQFDDWVESAIKQIFTIDKDCSWVDKMLDQCYGYHELYMELYPKSVLSLLTGMAFEANDKGLNGRDKHHILIYNYKDVDNIVTEVSDFFGMDPLPRTNQQHKQVRGEGTCPSEISEKFHKCHDETLMNVNAIRGLDDEKMRRKKNDRGMKHIRRCLRAGFCNPEDCNFPIQTKCLDADEQ